MVTRTSLLDTSSTPINPIMPVVTPDKLASLQRQSEDIRNVCLVLSSVSSLNSAG